MGSEQFNFAVDGIESIKLNVYYSLTINPCDKYQFFNYSEQTRAQIFYKENKNLLKDFLRFSTWNLNQEISKKSRLHFHGTIMWKNYDNLSLFFLRIKNLLDYSNIEIDVINDNERWHEYCIKQSHLQHARFLSSQQPLLEDEVEKGMKKWYKYMGLRPTTDQSLDDYVSTNLL